MPHQRRRKLFAVTDKALGCIPLGRECDRNVLFFFLLLLLDNILFYFFIIFFLFFLIISFFKKCRYGGKKHVRAVRQANEGTLELTVVILQRYEHSYFGVILYWVSVERHRTLFSL